MNRPWPAEKLKNSFSGLEKLVSFQMKNHKFEICTALKVRRGIKTCIGCYQFAATLQNIDQREKAQKGD